jgi:hypothetical protein
MTATQILGFVGTVAERCEGLKMKSNVSVQANVFSSLSGAELALLTPYETQVHLSCSWPCDLARFRWLRADGNDETGP